MKLEEAIKKYKINVPTDEEFYSEEYRKYFEENVKNEELKIKYGKYEEFHKMYIESFYVTFYRAQRKFNSKNKSIANSEAVILGGQVGAGKGGLVSVAKREFEEQGKEVFLIDDDQYRKFYPKEKREGILKECPEFYTKITAIGSSSITPKIMKYASDNGLNFIFDGTMKNPRIIETAMMWNNYKINWKVMGTSKMESLISVFERNEILRKKKDCRFITVDVHNETYYGLENTVMLLESISNIGKIQVYKRGNKPESPIKIYDSKEKDHKYETAVSALKEARKQDKERWIRGVSSRIKKLKNCNKNRNEAEKVALDELEKAIQLEELEK